MLAPSPTAWNWPRPPWERSVVKLGMNDAMRMSMGLHISYGLISTRESFLTEIISSRFSCLHLYLGRCAEIYMCTYMYLQT